MTPSTIIAAALACLALAFLVEVYEGEHLS